MIVSHKPFDSVMVPLKVMVKLGEGIPVELHTQLPPIPSVRLHVITGFGDRSVQENISIRSLHHSFY